MRIITNRVGGLSLQTALLTLPLCLYAAAAEIEIGTVEKAKDKVTVEVQPERAVFTVFSSDGIGGFKTTLKSGQWPRDVSILINRKRLENFGLETDRLRATGAVTSVTNCWCYFEFRNDEGKFEHEFGAGSLRIRVKETRDGVELAFPRNLFSDTKQFSFGWIDAYRR